MKKGLLLHWKKDDVVNYIKKNIKELNENVDRLETQPLNQLNYHVATKNLGSIEAYEDVLTIVENYLKEL